jgi:hypothetical protein
MDFSSIVADSSQEANPPGGLAVYIVLASSLTANWPVQAQASAGLVTTAPPLEGSVKFAKVTPPANSIDAMSEAPGRPGYQGIKHQVEWEVAGYSTTILLENQKYINAGIVALKQLADDKWIVLGSRQNPLYATQSTRIGRGGSDERGTKYIASRENFAWNPPILDNAVVAALTFAT